MSSGLPDGPPAPQESSLNGNSPHRDDKADAMLARLPVGYTVRDRYVIKRFISLGAATRVYAAEDIVGKRMVAIKVVRIDVGLQKGVVDRFQHEVLVCRLFDSPHLPRVYDQGRLDNGSLFMVMELLTGQTLDQRLGHGPLAVPTVVELGRQLSAALAASHARGIIHCDVKPHNLILKPDPDSGFLVKLIDFGIATRDHGRVDTGSRRETVLGTPAYMSPEQIKGMRVDVRTDIYSAGVVLYQALTDRLPFDANSSRGLMEAALKDPVIPARVLRPSCPASLERAIMRALCRDRSYRYTSAEEFGRELRELAIAEGLSQGALAWRQKSDVQAKPIHTPYDATQPLRRIEMRTSRQTRNATGRTQTGRSAEELRARRASQTGEHGR